MLARPKFQRYPLIKNMEYIFAFLQLETCLFQCFFFCLLLLSNSYLNKQSFQSYRCKLGITLFLFHSFRVSPLKLFCKYCNQKQSQHRRLHDQVLKWNMDSAHTSCIYHEKLPYLMPWALISAYFAQLFDPLLILFYCLFQ